MRPLLLVLMCATVWAQEYTGPEPPKADVPYLLHASHLVETESQEASKEAKKNETTFWINGEASTARTPLAEPIFIIKADKLRPESIELYRFDIKNHRRELTLKNNPKPDDPHPLHVNVTKLHDNLYKVEASEVLPNGEYSLSPNGTNEVFSFQVY